ncbi:MAG: tetratricopeptide repeat protein, partial [Planctomycetota bacterium]
MTLLALVGSILYTELGNNTTNQAFEYPDKPRATRQVEVVPAAYTHAYTTDGPRSLAELLALPSDEIEKLDIALINLLCAEGLPGAESLDIAGTLATLDRWAEHVRQETERHLYRLERERDDWGTEARWRVGWLATTLQQDCGVRYNPDRITDIDFTNSQDLFIHGLARPDLHPVRQIDHPEAAHALRQSTHGGTCASMPVLYAAVARRLGYPVTLSTTQAHVFCRWDGNASGEDPWQPPGKTHGQTSGATSGGHANPGYRDRFNFEATGRGVHLHDDAHYLAWPHPITQAYADEHGYLQSQNNTTALAGFLASRGHCLLDLGRLKQAQHAYAHAIRLNPDDPNFQAFLAEARQRLHPAQHRTERAHRRAEQAIPQRHNAWAQRLIAESQQRP